jgi:hypothetical protein
MIRRKFIWVEAINALNEERYLGELPAGPGRIPNRRNALKLRKGGLAAPRKNNLKGSGANSVYALDGADIGAVFDLLLYHIVSLVVTPCPYSSTNNSGNS